MIIETIVCGTYAANAYLLSRPDRPDVLLIDAGGDAGRIEAALQAAGKRLAAIVLTHGHFDHTLATALLCDVHHAALYIHEADADWLTDRRKSAYQAAFARAPFANRAADHLIKTPGGEGTLTLCGLDFRVIHTPGHTPGSICLSYEPEKALFTGDTLFAQGYGRMDLPGGDPAAMKASLERLCCLPDGYTIYPGHGESASLDRVKGGFI